MRVAAVSKRFPGVQALRAVSLDVLPGEVLAVIGENGAGKSTLMKIMAGIQPPDEGQLLLDGQSVQFSTPANAIHSGVALIHQELNLAENLSVAENVFLGREPRRLGMLRRGEMRDRAAEHLQQVGLDIDPTMPLADLPLAGQQLVEIAKALSADARLVIMDEPTSSLSARETDRLFTVVENLRSRGVSIVYISHRLAEVERLADRVEVLRDGANVGTLVGEQITHDAMVTRMVGRDLSQFFPHTPHTPGEVRLDVRQLCVATAPRHRVDLQVRAGEVVAIAGLVGAGRTELIETIFGIRKPLSGTATVDGQPLVAGSVRENIRRGIALVTEDRKSTGLLLDSSVRDNMTLAALVDAPAAPWTSPAWQQQQTARLVDQLGVRTASQQTTIATLSGGNQQKVALGKWLLRQPAVLMLDEPTRGVDIGAKHEIYELIEQLSADGVAVLFVSSEMEEVLGMADRVLVMHDGRIAGELAREAMSEEALMKLAVGTASLKSESPRQGAKSNGAEHGRVEE
ncbi:Ribose import ATP-binding protein RbsA [Roseimaritima ulvae]|uniref:Ribose import ATP-binding protein RbsA n=2 Tax=Roseimaritima ulvae TaxID=980254 RepID=A0A5B9R7U9_9BACT|nr:Ribose import ATP-binding protein RbsA [Roseimaritima ulvae]